METLSGLMLYNSAYRRFDYGSLSFDTLIRHVERQDAIPEGRKLYVVPGLIDIHMHIESSMTTPTEFAHASIPHGTTTIVSDCHEVANVFGLQGLLDFMRLPTINDTFYAVPSSVPASDASLETSGGSFDQKEVEVLAKERKIVALGEVMNANDLFSKDDNRTKRIIRTFKQLRPECPVEGHCPRLSGTQLDDFIAAGVDSDHTEQTPASIKEKASKGIFLEIQYKSLKSENVEALREIPGSFSLCTDDVLPDTLQREGQLDRVLRKSIALGLKPEDAIYASTTAPAERMHFTDRGMLAPGKIADFVILDDLNTFSILRVYKHGKLVYDREQGLLVRLPLPSFSHEVLHAIQRKTVSPEAFVPHASESSFPILTIVHQPHSTMTKRGKRMMKVKDGKVVLEDLNILAAVERYGHESPVEVGLLENGLKKRGAICSSWAHDSHNLLVLATSPELAAKAVNLVIDHQGGVAMVDDDASSFVPLSYGGIVSLEPMEKLALSIAQVRSWLRSHGYEADDEVMNFAVLALPVSPEVKITDKGVVDAESKQILDWRNYWR